MGPMAERARITVRGVVQGVGFRPYVFNLAGSLGLTGYIANTADGVLIDIEGGRLPEFVEELRNAPPPLARIVDISVTPLPRAGYRGFTIRKSTDDTVRRPFTLLSPDVSVCSDCFRELFDPDDRRYLYPFINCTNCGPRFTITRSVPYDRANTTMAPFRMCPECQREYDDPTNRRFHAQPNACPACGPAVVFTARDSTSGAVHGDPIAATIGMLKGGGIVAVKGLGGFHIACDAGNESAVRRLRERKRKSNKPFAVMCPDLDSAERFCLVSSEEKELLTSRIRPIVLLCKKDQNGIGESVAPNNNSLGVMLPYTPLHYLLFFRPLEPAGTVRSPHFSALVMTSGNRSEEPIVSGNEEALRELADLVDGYLLHDRDIFMRADDSVVRMIDAAGGDGDRPETPSSGMRRETFSTGFIRRSRGYVPDPIPLAGEGPEVLGCGADLKNTFTLTKGGFAIPSQHIGDMENYETLRFYEDSLANLKAVYRVDPAAIVHDLHPGYLSTQWAQKQAKALGAAGKLACHGIQHHYAHIGSVMAEHGLRGPVIGVAFDGTGYGSDGNLWGGEFLIAGIDGFERKAQLAYLPLPGGEAAIREPWKTAVAIVAENAGRSWESVLEKAGFPERYGRECLEQVVRISRSRELSPLASGAGRLFDAVGALLGICDRNTFEGETAMALEAAIEGDGDDRYEVESRQEGDHALLDFWPAVSAIIGESAAGVPRGIIAHRFHATVASAVVMTVTALHRRTGIRDVALSGGTFQNLYLLKRIRAELEAGGLAVYRNVKVPPNDACISLGQAYLVRERMKKGRWA